MQYEVNNINFEIQKHEDGAYCAYIEQRCVGCSYDLEELKQRLLFIEKPRVQYELL